jgi:hypothetical protein
VCARGLPCALADREVVNLIPLWEDAWMGDAAVGQLGFEGRDVELYI